MLTCFWNEENIWHRYNLYQICNWMDVFLYTIHPVSYTHLMLHQSIVFYFFQILLASISQAQFYLCYWEKSSSYEFHHTSVSYTHLEYPAINPPYVTPDMAGNWTPYQRNEETGVRYWAIPGTCLLYTSPAACPSCSIQKTAHSVRRCIKHISTVEIITIRTTIKK